MRQDISRDGKEIRRLEGSWTAVGRGPVIMEVLVAIVAFGFLGVLIYLAFDTAMHAK